ncbi:MAG TPA: TIGR03435 family protein [Bryobacteraceae bacterium]|jgi:uncharacterized protein (TIGR03435 family)|nr:TIGR03435 family protein [Bryobacteraceae bacterium]
MASMFLMRAGLALLLAPVVMAQQTNAPRPRFEVVSIRAVPPNPPPLSRPIDFTAVQPGGKYIDQRIPLAWMIAFAYDIKWSEKYLLGLPRWGKEQSYSVAAKAGDEFPVLSPADNREQVRLMMRAMLEDRFHLKLHSEDRTEPIFHLEVAKGGFKFKEVDAPVPPQKEGYVGVALGDASGALIGKKSTIAGLAKGIEIWLGRSIVDVTGLTGYYDFEVRWKSPDAVESRGLGTEGITMLVSNLQSQFGLRLTNATGPVKYWIVDHVEPPTEN